MENRTVLVTGIGGNVGQGIIRNIRSTKYPIKVVGCNIAPFSAGNHLCDSFYEVPYAYSEDYCGAIEQIVIQEKVDVILPSTDYEVYYLAKNQSRINCKVVVSKESTAKIYLDKYHSYLHHVKYNIPFAKSFRSEEQT